MCWQVDIKEYINARCATFVMNVIVSMIGLGISIAGLCGAFAKGPDTCFWTSLIMLIIGVYVPQPSLKKKEDSELRIA